MSEIEIEEALLLSANSFKWYGNGGNGYVSVGGKDFYNLLDLVAYINKEYEVREKK